MSTPPQPGSLTGGGVQRNVRFTPTSVVAIAVAVLLVVSQLASAVDYFGRSTLSTLTAMLAIVVIASIGQAFVIGTGGIDLSVPATMTLVGVIVVKASEGENSGLAGALALAICACLAIGLLNGIFVEAFGLNSLVVTLAMSQLVAGATRLYRGDVSAISDVPPRLSDWASASIGGVSYAFLIAIAIAIAGGFFLRRAVFGRRLVASSAASRAAFYSGLRARGYRIAAYMLASLTYGLGALLLAGQVKAPDLTLGNPYLLITIVAVVLGGAVLTGGRVSPVATLLGATFVTVLDYVLQVEGLSTGIRLIVQGVVLALALSLVTLISSAPRAMQLLRRRPTKRQPANSPL